MPNFFNFSRTTGSCSTCDCNLAGSLDQECDLVTGDCNCKTFVTGAKCSQCIPGTSNLDIINPYGCSKCKYLFYNSQNERILETPFIC